jgi:hypothetical protein
LTRFFTWAALWIKDSQNSAQSLIDPSDLPEKALFDTVTFAKILTEASEESAPISFYKKPNEAFPKATRSKKISEIRFRRFQAREELEI